MRLVAMWMLLWPFPALAAEIVWATDTVESVRFADADVKGPTFEAKARLEVLFRDGDRVRVRRGDSYGWIPAAKTTATAPEGAETEAPSQLDDEQIRQLIEQMKLGPAQGQ